MATLKVIHRAGNYQYTNLTSWFNRMLSSSDLVQRGNRLQVTLKTTNNSTDNKKSPEFIISGSATFQVKIVDRHNLMLLRIDKLHEDDVLTYTMKITSNKLGIDKSFITIDGTWQQLCEYYLSDFDLTVVMDVVPGLSPFAPLHEDQELTDFELRGENGSVRMHRAVLAASSPVLQRMLCGTWRENTDGHVDIPGISIITLQHFKDYMYLQTLPETGLEQLLLLASYYMMPELEQKCVFKLVNNLSAENVFELVELITKHKVTRLLLAILERVQGGYVDVKEMRNHFLGDKSVL